MTKIMLPLCSASMKTLKRGITYILMMLGSKVMMPRVSGWRPSWIGPKWPQEGKFRLTVGGFGNNLILKVFSVEASRNCI